MAAAAQSFSVGCFPMVPWAGRLGNATLNAVGNVILYPPINHHMRCMVWLLLNVGNHRQNSRFPDFTYAPASPWPWQGEVIQTFLLENDGWFCNWKSIHMPIHSRPPLAASVVCEKADSAKYRIVAGAFDADWQEEAGSDELPTGNRIFLKSVPGMTVLVFMTG